MLLTINMRHIFSNTTLLQKNMRKSLALRVWRQQNCSDWDFVETQYTSKFIIAVFLIKICFDTCHEIAHLMKYLHGHLQFVQHCIFHLSHKLFTSKHNLEDSCADTSDQYIIRAHKYPWSSWSCHKFLSWVSIYFNGKVGQDIGQSPSLWPKINHLSGNSWQTP